MSYNELWSLNTWENTIRKCIMITNFKLEIAEIFQPELIPVLEFELEMLKEQLENNFFNPDNVYLVQIIDEYVFWLDNEYNIVSLII